MAEISIESNNKISIKDVVGNSDNEEDDGWIGPLPSMMMNEVANPKKRKGNNLKVMFLK